jgi:tetrathionate reductase subunit B
VEREDKVKTTDQTDHKRRDFLKTGVAASAVTLAPGIVMHTAEAAPRDKAVDSSVRWGMLIDTSKCASGCDSCVQACNDENGLEAYSMPEGADPEKWDQQRPKWMRSVTLKDNLSGRITNLPLMCQHCESPPCADVCPTGASFRRADGVVMVDRHICIGCRYCMMACPYKARSFIHENVDIKPELAPRGKGCVESCNFCVHRLDDGQTTTACQDACPENAIIFGDLNDPNSEVSKALAEYPSVQIRADLKLNTGVRYSGI